MTKRRMPHWKTMAAAMAAVIFGTYAPAQSISDDEPDSGDDTSSRGAQRLVDVDVSLYRGSLTSGERALYDEIFSHFADAVFEATEGQHVIDEVTVFLDGQPVFDPAPVITINGNNPLFLEANSTYTEAGATALDFPDGPLPVTISGSVNTSVEGTYTITYRATDSAGQLAVDTRTVFVRGRDPVIGVLGQNPIWIPVNSFYTDAGAIALDITDGNLTPFIETFDFVDTSEEGVYQVFYVVTDSAGNTTVEFRTVNVIPDNYDEPIVTLTGPNPMTIDANTPYIEPGFTATDATDGDITFTVDVIGSVNTAVSGTYELIYLATDLDGNPGSASRFVNVIGRDPVLVLLGLNPVTVEAGPPYIDPGAFALDVTDGNLTSVVQTEIDVDSTKPGLGTVSYSVTDSDGNTSFAVRTVHVVESANGEMTSNIYWSETGVPGFRQAGGLGTNGGHIQMVDIFPGAEAGADINFLATAEDRRRAGYILAALWMQYALGLGGEFEEQGSDIAVLNSLLADPYTPAFATNGLGLNVSATRDGVATGGVFQTLEHTGATPQHRLHGASAWKVISQTYGEDAKPPRLIAKRPRTAFAELRNNAPTGDAAPATNLGSIPTGAFSGAIYQDDRRSWFRIGTENTLPIVAGERIRTADTCLPGRLIDVRTPNPVVFEFPSDTSINELIVAISTPCTDDVSNLDAALVDPLGRAVAANVFPSSGVIEFRKTPSVPGTWRLTITPRSVSVSGVLVEVVGRSFGETHRISAELVNAPSNLATSTVSYPNPFVLQISDSRGAAVQGLDVMANMVLPTGSEMLIPFVDDGTSPDLFANDGIYSATVPYFQNGVHQFEFSMSDLDGNARYSTSGMAFAPRLGFSSVERTPPPAAQPVGDPFMRNLITSFFVTGVLPDDHGNTFLEATAVPLTNRDTVGRFDPGGDTDYFRFDVAARGTTADIVVRLTHRSGNGQMRLTLFDSSGTNEIATSSNSPAGYPMIRENLVSGRYYVAVTSQNAKQFDTYSISVGAPIPSDTARVGIGTGVGAPRGGGGGGGGGCFIATAAYGTPLEAEIGILRNTRDDYLLTNSAGAAFSDAYYRLSPPIADWVAQSTVARETVRVMLYFVLHPAWILIAMITLGAAGTVARGLVMRRMRH